MSKYMAQLGIKKCSKEINVCAGEPFTREITLIPDKENQ
jgi:hypothetical protein